MKKYHLIILMFAKCLTSARCEAVADPIKDFLSLPMEERYSEDSFLSHVIRVSCDIDGDHTDELLIGSPMMWVGDSKPKFFFAYKPSGSGYVRLMSEEKYLMLYLGFFNRECAYCGFVEERKSEGLLICELNRNSKEHVDGFLPPIKFYHLVDNKMVVDEIGNLDRSKPEGEAFYQKYYGEGVKSRPITIEDYSLEKLKEMGYEIPNWKEMPKSMDEALAIKRKNTSEKVGQEAMTTVIVPNANKQSPKETPMAEPSVPFDRSWVIWLLIVLAATSSVVLLVRKRK